MYKLFLCLRYLRRRYLALIAVAAVALCVAMVLIVVSVMDGFLAKVEGAAKGLFGDVVLEAGLGGVGMYDEFIARLTGQYRLEIKFELLPGSPNEPAMLRFGGKVTPTQGRGLAEFRPSGGPQARPGAPGAAAGPMTFPAVSTLWSGGRQRAQVVGQLTLNGDLSVEFVCPAPGEAAQSVKSGGAALGPVYARIGDGLPEVEAATPTIVSYALLRVNPRFTDTISVFGVRLPDRLGVTNFGKGLFVQSGWDDASFDPPLEELRRVTEEHIALIGAIERREMSVPPERRNDYLLDRLPKAMDNLTGGSRHSLAEAVRRRDLEQRLRRELAAEQAKPPERRDRAAIEQLARELDALLGEFKTLRNRRNAAQMELADELDKPENQRNLQRVASLRTELDSVSLRLDTLLCPPGQRLILGLGINGLWFRTPEGENVRLIGPGMNATLSLLPLGGSFLPTTLTPNTETFTIVDDAKTDVFSIDSRTVYVPFDTLQRLTDMGETFDRTGRSVRPACCTQIQVKVRAEHASQRRLVHARENIQSAWRAFVKEHPEAEQSAVGIQTWRERLDKFIGPIEKQRTLVTLMFGIISFVSVLLIFAIFYMIVVQKTRDIGIIRAVGGSGGGVAQIFLAYGAATGVVGSALGLALGYFFVRYINEIQDWLASWSGFRVWDRDVFMFDRIPNQVDPWVAAVIAAWAIASGLVGALIPGVRAAVMEPVEAIRYE